MQKSRCRDGVYYALTEQGVELPIVDVTLPAFAISLSETEQREKLEHFLAESRQLERLPRFLNALLMRWFLRGSVLARSVRAARGSFLPGLDTYLFKLGPDHLPPGCNNPIDRRLAAALPALGMRLRLERTAQLLADALASSGDEGAASSPAEARAPRRRRPLHLLNIAGGPALDSINALLLLQRDRPAALAERSIRVIVLDRDDQGPRFGQRALEALQMPGAPLHDLSVELSWVQYDWSQPEKLREVLATARQSRAHVSVSSEGGLFDYGSDHDIVANLVIVREGTEARAAVVGSVTRDDPATRDMIANSRAGIVPRSLPACRALAARAGFELERAIEGPFSDQILLRPLPRAARV